MKKKLLLAVFAIAILVGAAVNVYLGKLSDKMSKTKLPTHIDLPCDDAGLAKDSIILLEQIRTLDKRRLKERIGELPTDTMKKVNQMQKVKIYRG